MPDGQLSPRAGFMSPSPSAISQLGWNFHTLRGGIDHGHLRFRPRVVGVVEMGKIFVDGSLTLPVRRNLALARGATVAALWLHDPQPISNLSVGLGLSLIHI